MRKANLIAQRIKIITGFSMMTHPIIYLGAPLYESLIDKVRAKISRCEHCDLSYGVRLQLIKSVLSSTPIYLLQVLNPPVGIIQKLEQLFAKYFRAAQQSKGKSTGLSGKTFAIPLKKWTGVETSER
ncbi:UNVERIFIED_CONTAM: hypothetical protein Sangu_2450700 [Sesamum angustifolium]|uniref:Uncharacterized protein n=1 Tax=Sesamum angustifolium TaxID=2727405 RepID=A0AAW2L034_9LAMI